MGRRYDYRKVPSPVRRRALAVLHNFLEQIMQKLQKKSGTMMKPKLGVKIIFPRYKYFHCQEAIPFLHLFTTGFGLKNAEMTYNNPTFKSTG